MSNVYKTSIKSNLKDFKSLVSFEEENVTWLGHNFVKKSVLRYLSHFTLNYFSTRADFKEVIVFKPRKITAGVKHTYKMKFCIQVEKIKLVFYMHL